MTEPLSETQAGDEITGKCDENIIPIFPVRHALTEDALFNIARDGYSPGIPTAIDASKDHELRRIRQGYIYIYAKNGHPDKLSSDEKGTWLVFRYVSRPDIDDNSGHIRADVQVPNGHYQFYKLEWKDGSANGQWEQTDNRYYPYAFVNKQVSNIEIAYSEERWPGYLFEMAEIDAGTRAKLMTPVNIIKKTTEHSAPLAELSKVVAEFSPDAPKDPIGNAIRYTAFQPETETRVITCQNSRENGRIVAVQDHLGELLDIQSAHLVKSHSLKMFSAEYMYPMMIGQGVKNVWEHIDHPGGFWDFMDANGSPLDENYLGVLDSLETRHKVLNDEIANLVATYFKISTRKGSGTVTAEIDVALNGLESAKGEAEVRRVDYVFFLLSRVFQTMGTSAAGSVAMEDMFSDTGTGDYRKWFKIFTRSFSVMATASTNLSKKYRTHMNITLSVTAKEMANSWVKRPSSLLLLEQVEKSLGVEKKTITATPKDIDDKLRQSFASLGFLGERPNNVVFKTDEVAAELKMAKSLPEGTQGGSILIPAYEEVEVTGALTAKGQVMSDAYRAGDLGSKGGALALSFYVAFQTLHNWEKVSRSYTQVGAFARDPRVQIASALLDITAGIRAIRNVPGSVNYAQGVSKDIFNRLIASRSGGYFSKESLASQTRNGAQATSRGMLRYVTIGNLAGAVGVILLGFHAYEGFKASDNAAGVGNSLAAVGGLIILVTGATGAGIVAGAIVGGLMIIAGTAMTLFMDSDVDSWVRNGFWGSSEFYWEREERPKIEERIDQGKLLAKGEEPQKSAFEQELIDYRDLTGTLRIENNNEGDLRFEIICPSVENIVDLVKLQVTIRHIAGIGLGSSVYGPTLNFERFLVEPGLIHLVLTKPAGKGFGDFSDITVDASYPKLNGGEYSDSLTVKARKA